MMHFLKASSHLDYVTTSRTHAEVYPAVERSRRRVQSLKPRPRRGHERHERRGEEGRNDSKYRSQWSGNSHSKTKFAICLCKGFIVIPWTFFKRLISDILVPYIARAILPMVGCCGCDLVGGLWCHCLVQHKNWSIADCMLYIWGLCWNNIHVQQP